MSKLYPVQKIDLTKLEEWKPYDLTDALNDDLVQSAHSMLEAMNWTDTGYAAELFLEKGKRKHVHLSYEEKVALHQAVSTHDDRLETFNNLLRDAAFWSWEEALSPTKADLAHALKTSVHDVPLDLGGWILGDRIGEMLEPLGYVDQRTFIQDLLKDADISIEQKEGHYEIFLIYDPASTQLVKRILEQPSDAQEYGVLDWAPRSAKNPEVDQELVNLFNDLKPSLIRRLFKNLETDRQNTDFSNRVCFQRWLRTVIKTHPDTAQAAKELREFLHGSPSLGANPFMNAPRTRRLAKDFEEMKALAEISPILEMETHGDPPERYLLRFHGLGLDPEGGTRNFHEVRVDLGAEYPRAMPRVHWQTPILHPNIAGGTACFGNLVMNPRVRLVDLVEIIWDMTRMALYNAGHNDTWKKIMQTYGFPVDPRTIRGEVPQGRDPGEGGVDLIIMGQY